MSAALDHTRDAARYVGEVRKICSHAGLPELADRYIAGNLSANLAMIRLADRFAEMMQQPVRIFIDHDMQFP